MQSVESLYSFFQYKNIIALCIYSQYIAELRP